MTLEIFTSQLSLGTQSNYVTHVHQVMQSLGRSVPVSETASQHGCSPESASDRAWGAGLSRINNAGICQGDS